MELMSSMLLCALVALLPQTLGKNDFGSNMEIKKAHRANKNSPRALILNMKGAFENENIDLNSIYDDIQCQVCHSCMDRAIKAQIDTTHFTKYRPSTQELHEDLLRNQVVDKRYKRDVKETNSHRRDPVKARTSKPQKNKLSKSASVTKYDLNGEVYALKIKEINVSDLHREGGFCQLYSVKKSLPCESPESDQLLSEIRRNSKKTDKTNKTTSAMKAPIKLNSTIFPTTKIPTIKLATPEVNVAIFKKREADNSEMPDFMPSIEEMY